MMDAIGGIHETEITSGVPSGQETTVAPEGTGAAWSPASLEVRLALSSRYPQVKGYTILAELGRGGVGIVYKARQERLNRVVALKMLRAGEQATWRERARFEVEAEAMARLRHPHIVQIHESGEEQGQPYLALEYVAGGTLRERLVGHPQPFRAAAELIEQLARALHAAHQRQVVHGDITPANILLEPPLVPPAEEDPHARATRHYGVPRIADFGLARRLDQDADGVRPGEILGTPAYMAPEQADGRVREIGPATDVHALGVLLYEMLTGRPPFHDESIFQLLQMVIADSPVPPRRRHQQVPRDLEAICLKCLAKAPQDRYHSALDLALDLRRFLSGRPVQARPAPLPERLGGWSRRNPRTTGLLLMLTALLVLGLADCTRLFGDRNPEPQPGQEARISRSLLPHDRFTDSPGCWPAPGERPSGTSGACRR